MHILLNTLLSKHNLFISKINKNRDSSLSLSWSLRSPQSHQDTVPKDNSSSPDNRRRPPPFPTPPTRLPDGDRADRLSTYLRDSTARLAHLNSSTARLAHLNNSTARPTHRNNSTARLAHRNSNTARPAPLNSSTARLNNNMAHRRFRSSSMGHRRKLRRPKRPAARRRRILLPLSQVSSPR